MFSTSHQLVEVYMVGVNDTNDESEEEEYVPSLNGTDVTPLKTSAQCRHKMEKLRQRHRTEKQRASLFPGGQFFSSWFYFEAMEAMANGPSFEPGNNNSTNLEINNATPVSDHQNLNPTVEFKPSSLQNLVTLATSSTNHTPDFDSRFSNHNSSYTNNWSNQEDNNEEDGYLDNSTVNEPPIHPGYKNHKSSSYKTLESFSP